MQLATVHISAARDPSVRLLMITHFDDMNAAPMTTDGAEIGQQRPLDSADRTTAAPRLPSFAATAPMTPFWWIAGSDGRSPCQRV
jgi:hypothetical protein